jgi:hypothetical protein
VIDNSTADSLALFPFSSSHVLSLYGYILSRLSMIVGYNIGGMTYLHLHLYPHVTNPIDHCSFPYISNFMAFTKQLAFGPRPYINWLLDSDIVPSSVLQIMHSNVLSNENWPSRPQVFWGDLVTLFWFLVLTGSWNLQFLVTILCSDHPHIYFQICNTKGLILKLHHATTIRIIINNMNSRGVTIPTKLIKKHAKKVMPGKISIY